MSDIEDVRKAYPLLDMVDRERRYDQINVRRMSNEKIEVE